ncbi:MAG: glycosyltransferase family 4 protein [Thermodesulfobacteriota bacterium]
MTTKSAPISVLALSAAGSDDRSAYTHRVMMLAQCLRERSIPCDVFNMPDHPPLDTETTASLFMPLWLRTLRRASVIYCGAQEAGQALFFCRPFLSAPVILDVHGDVIAQSALANEIESGGANKSASLRVRLIDRLAMASADHILTVSKFQTETFLRQGIPRQKITLIRNGVDLDVFRQVPFPARPPFTFGYIGDFQSWQGIDNLIDAFRLVPDPGIRMLLLGFREGDRDLKDRFRSIFGPRVELIDRTDRSTLIQWVRDVGILIIPRIDHPAIRHAFPTKFAEYAAMGRPILVNSVDETADFVTRYQCGFVSAPDPASVAVTMTQAATTDVQALAEMGKRARIMAQESFSWDSIGEAYARIVSTLAQDGRR